MTVEIIRITDIYPRHPDEADYDLWHIRVMTPEGPAELRLTYEEFEAMEKYLWAETGNYFYGSYEELKFIE